MSRLTRDGTAEPVSRDQILRHARGQGNIIFPVQLTTSRIGNLTRLIHTLLYVMTIHNPSIPYTRIGSLGFTDDKIDTHRRAYQVLPSTITFEVDRGILHRAHSPTEAWTNLKEWHNPDKVSTIQTLHQRFLSYIIRPDRKPRVTVTVSEEMTSQLSQQKFQCPLNQTLIQFLFMLTIPGTRLRNARVALDSNYI